MLNHFGSLWIVRYWKENLLKYVNCKHIESPYFLTVLLSIPLNKLSYSQPRDEDALDPVFLEKLHAVLNLTDANDIHVILDNHGDMVGTAGCGNGVPMWFQQKAAPELIGIVI